MMKDFKLNEFPKISSGFQPTDAYLEQLNQQILQKISSEAKEPKPTKVLRMTKPWMAIAASLMVLMGWMLWNQNQTNWLESIPAEQIVLQKKYTHYFDYADLLTEDDIQKLYQDLEITEIEYWQNNEEYWY